MTSKQIQSEGTLTTSGLENTEWIQDATLLVVAEFTQIREILKNQMHNYFFNKLSHSILAFKFYSPGEKSNGSWLKTTFPRILWMGLAAAKNSWTFCVLRSVFQNREKYFLVQTTAPQDGRIHFSQGSIKWISGYLPLDRKNSETIVYNSFRNKINSHKNF